MIDQKRELLHPRDQIVMIMQRIYGYGMTTTSGGNLSIRDENGDIWISPAGFDKGSLSPQDVVCVHPDGKVSGIHKPSSELPFHRAIYDARSDAHAILHAHPPALVSFSVVRTVPDTRILPTARMVCGEVGYAPYDLPGSSALGDKIAKVFGEGYNTVLLENHGIACTGDSLFEAFQRFETLDFCARLILESGRIGTPHNLAEEQLSFIKGTSHLLPEFDPPAASSRERELRSSMSGLISRAYDQMLFTSTEGTFSARLGRDAFLITPYGVDRKYLAPSDIVLIHRGMRERTRVPSRSVLLHEKIYARHPEVNAVIIAHPPNVMAFGVAHVKFDSRTIPESYVMLRDVPLLKFGMQYTEREKMAELIGPSTPIVIIENDCVMVVGKTLLEAYDRLEVAEFSAKAIIAARSVGPVSPISDEQVVELKAAFGIS
jgi:L-fuculose-phosphate aldolase